MSEVKRRPGRPPDLAKRRAVIEATLEELAEVGYAALTLDRVAQRANSNRVLIYRVWDSKAALVADALFGTAADLEVPSTGDLRGDLRQLIAQLAATMSRPAYLNGAPGLTVDMLRNKAGWREIYSRYIKPAEDALATILDNARQRGELTSDVDVRTATYLISGAITSLAQGMRIGGDELVDTVLSAVLGGFIDGVAV